MPVKLTCVTAVFNAVKAGNAEKLERCIRSVAALKTPHEHILVDGASTDGTVELLEKLQEEGRGTRDESEGRERPSSIVPSLRIISEPDTGIYNALNKGLKAAQGEWFYVLGSDDYICEPEVLERLLAKENPATEMIVAPVVYNNSRHYAFKKLSDLRGVLRWGYGYCHQGLVMKTEVARRHGGFDERYRLCADGDLMLKVHRAAAKFHYTFEAFANFAPGGANETNRDGVENETVAFLKEQLELTEEESSHLRENWLPPYRVVRKYYLHPDLALRIGARDVADEYLNAFFWAIGLWKIYDLSRRAFWQLFVRVSPAFKILAPLAFLISPIARRMKRYQG